MGHFQSRLCIHSHHCFWFILVHSDEHFAITYFLYLIYLVSWPSTRQSTLNSFFVILESIAKHSEKGASGNVVLQHAILGGHFLSSQQFKETWEGTRIIPVCWRVV